MKCMQSFLAYFPAENEHSVIMHLFSFLVSTAQLAVCCLLLKYLERFLMDIEILHRCVWLESMQE